MMKGFKTAAVTLLGMILLMTGCAAVPVTPSDVTEMKQIKAPVYPETGVENRAEGSLWSSTGIDMYTDRKARQVGDIVVVRIVEDPQASLNANTNVSRSSGINAKLKFLGYMDALAAKNPRLAQNPGVDDLISSELGSEFNGSGTSDREGYIKAYVSAVVVKVFPNGNLFINGKREIKVNNEAQYIALSGIVRPEDITSTNEVSSTYVADARIYYSGVGAVADKQKPGWMGKVVDHVWPF
ncbi:MAG: flagellar basal body L-ring protein FlgH [Desulfotignum sp.]|nr:flagellar basal body L-ring protein FlgH [Desulfotignum sp.]MCF8136076.1 flagellar basal body L-ring protein FlgH [Desulfotignum sp.]